MCLWLISIMEAFAEAMEMPPATLTWSLRPLVSEFVMAPESNCFKAGSVVA